MAEKPPDRHWVIIRHIPSGEVHFAGWAKATGNGYVFEAKVPPCPAGRHEREFKYERQPIRGVGNFW